MKYKEVIRLKDGTECLIRNAEESDAEAVCHNFSVTHGETDFLLSYPDESHFTLEQERTFLMKKETSDVEIELCAFVDGHLVGTAGIDQIGSNDKVKHRAEFGIGLERAYWRRGIGQALVAACIKCARQAGYLQLELEVVSTNTGAIALYQRAGFVEYGRNPRGFQLRGGETATLQQDDRGISRSTSPVWQELVLMRLELCGL